MAFPAQRAGEWGPAVRSARSGSWRLLGPGAGSHGTDRTSARGAAHAVRRPDRPWGVCWPHPALPRARRSRRPERSAPGLPWSGCRTFHSAG